MKTIPILLSTPMASANINRQKTETRRTRGLKVINENPDSWLRPFSADSNNVFLTGDSDNNRIEIKSPYGKPGDVLWFREAYNINPSEHLRAETPYVYRCDYVDMDENEDPIVKWKPNIHMPRIACRQFGLITEIKIERLHDMTNKDAIAEGIYQVTKDGSVTKYTTYGMNESWQDMSRTPLDAYMKLWDKINGKDSHLQNPWVWVIKYEFKTQLNS